MHIQRSKHQMVFKSLWPSRLLTAGKPVPRVPLPRSLKSCLSFSTPKMSVLGSWPVLPLSCFLIERECLLEAVPVFLISCLVATSHAVLPELRI